MSDFDGFGFDWNHDGRVGLGDEFLTFHVMQNIPKEEARDRYEDMKRMRERGLTVDQAEFEACARLLGEDRGDSDAGGNGLEIGVGIGTDIYDKVYGGCSSSGKGNYRDDIAINGSAEEADVGDFFTYIPDDETDPLESRKHSDDAMGFGDDYDDSPWVDGVDYEDSGYDYWAECERIDREAEEGLF